MTPARILEHAMANVERFPMAEDGMFGWLLAARASGKAGSEADRKDAIKEAQEAFEGVVMHVARTKFSHEDHTKITLALSAVLGAWACVIKAREAV